MRKGRTVHQTVVLGSHTSQGNVDYSDLNCLVLFTQQTPTVVHVGLTGVCINVRELNQSSEAGCLVGDVPGEKSPSGPPGPAAEGPPAGMAPGGPATGPWVTVTYPSAPCSSRLGNQQMVFYAEDREL